MNVRFIIVFLFVNTCFGQIPFLEIDLNDIQSNWSIKDAYLIKDKQTNDYYSILEEDKRSYGFKFDSTARLIKQIESEGLKRKYKEIIGHIVKDDKVLLIQKNNKGNKFGYILYDFKTGQTKEAEYDIEKRSDRFVESFVASDRCIFYTINVMDDTLKKWEFKIDGSFTVKEINFNNQFRSIGIMDKKLASYILKSVAFSTEVDLVKVNNRIPNNIEIAAEPNKMYEYEKSFIWTLDGDLEHTILVYFNYPDFEPKMRIIRKSRLEKNKGRSNSFLFEDKIAQVVSNNNELIVDVKSIANDKNIFKSLKVDRNEDISFRNSPILQEGSMYSFGGTRKMEKTSKLLRKMSSEDNGISVNENNGNYHVTIGGKRVQNSGAPMVMPGFGAMPVGQFGAMTISYNPTFYAYGMYSSTGSTRIECLFDENFNHLDGEIEPNVFDRVDDFKVINENIIKVESINYIDDKVIFGYLNPRTHKYLFKTFEL